MIKVKLQIDGKSVTVIEDNERAWGTTAMQAMVASAIYAIQNLEKNKDE